MTKKYLLAACEKCERWTRLEPGYVVEGMVYPHHKPECPLRGQWTPTKWAHVRDAA